MKPALGFPAIGLFCLGIASVSSSQGLSANASVAGVPAAEAEIKVLRQQLLVLEGRVHELEKKADQAVDNGDAEAKEKKQLDKRLDAIENKQKTLESDQQKAEQEGISHVRAPFTVYDKNDHAIFQVELTAKNTARVTVGNVLGMHTSIYGNDQTGQSGLEVDDGVGADDGRIQIVVQKPKNTAYISIGSTTNDQRAWLGSASDNAVGLYILNKSQPVGFFGEKASGKGFMHLDDAEGSIMVEAGSLDTHVGYVLVNPWQPSSTPQGDPSVLKGGRQKK
ncbi:MAG: hypothetical protein ABI145_18000 [Steroidobacteraceae bacterium]